MVIATVSTAMTLVAGTLMNAHRPRAVSVDRIGALVGGTDRHDRRVWRQRAVSFGGRLLAVALMLLGIGFLTVITAALTSTFVARSTYLDATAIDTLEQLHDELAERGVTVAVARLKGPEGRSSRRRGLPRSSAQSGFSRSSARRSMRSGGAGGHPADAPSGVEASSRTSSP